MPVQKQPVSIPFSKGINNKSDPWQLQIGEFEVLNNYVFTKDGLMKKRNGYGSLPSLPDTSSAYVTTLNDNLTAIGTAITAYDAPNGTWISRGDIQPMRISTLPLIRNSVNQAQTDTAIAPNGLICTVYTETNGGSTVYKYAVASSETGQNIIAPMNIPVASGAVTGSPRVFIIGNYFIIIFTNTITAVEHLQYIAVSWNNPSSVTLNTDIATYVSSPALSWDAVTLGDNLYIAYNTLSGGQSVQVKFLTQALALSAATVLAGQKSTVMTITTDVSNPSVPLIYLSYYDLASFTGYTAVLDQFKNVITAPVLIIPSGTILNLASTAKNGVATIYSEVSNNYSYDSAIPTHYINAVTVTQAGVVGTPYVVIRSVGLASKAFLVDGVSYFLSAYQSSYQPSYFLINGSRSTSASPVISAKLAYSNGGGNLTLGLPSVTVTDSLAQFSYLFKDAISSVNKDTNVPSGTQVAGIYSQTGINLANLDITTSDTIDTSEIAGDLHISGGFLWMYDGYLPVEQNFFVYPDNVEATPSTTGGTMTAQQYFYQVVYEWSDNQGNIHRSAPSIPITTTTTGSTGSVTVHIPTLRLTYKVANKVKITVFRWSVAQQIYYQVTSVSSVTLNSTTADSIDFVDTLPDSAILGNSIIYTNGGVVENTNPPATNIMTLFDTRLWLVDAEDQNLLWYSKQVIEATPVEMSDLLTVYIAPNTGTTASTGPITALVPMGDKLIIFKKNAIYYINGSGPDNTGANSQYSQPIFITSTVGCTNQKSIVLMPDGLMFQSDKGIWLLKQDAQSTSYIGAAVENFNNAAVTSANAIPETNQVRLTITSGETLVYDYYFTRWGTFIGVPAVSSTIYQGQHSFINAQGLVFQETPGLYVDGSEPVLMSFTTGWINVAGLQGYQRAFFFFLLGQYLSPHKLSIGVAYDYNSSIYQSSMITPANFSNNVPAPYGVPVPFGGPGNVENWRVFLGKQRCQSFQITLNELFDLSAGFPPGPGLTLSGLNLVVGIKSGWRNIGSNRTVGGDVARG